MDSMFAAVRSSGQPSQTSTKPNPAILRKFGSLLSLPKAATNIFHKKRTQLFDHDYSILYFSIQTQLSCFAQFVFIVFKVQRILIYNAGMVPDAELVTINPLQANANFFRARELKLCTKLHNGPRRPQIFWRFSIWTLGCLKILILGKKSTIERSTIKGFLLTTQLTYWLYGIDLVSSLSETFLFFSWLNYKESYQENFKKKKSYFRCILMK